MNKEKRIERCCQAWSKGTNAQCKNRALQGTYYCWSHYPKKVVLLRPLLLIPVTLLVTLIFNDPLVWLLAKVPFLCRLDKSPPLILSISPNIDRSSSVDAKTKLFSVSFSEKDSGIDVRKSTIRVSAKTYRENVSLQGQVKITPSNISFLPQTELKFGEYLLEVLLIDNAGNKNRFVRSFVVRPPDQISAFVEYHRYKSAPSGEKKLFDAFVGRLDKDLLESFNLRIYELSIANADYRAVLKNLYLKVTLPHVFLHCEQIGAFNAKTAEIYGPAAALFDKRLKEAIYANTDYFNIEEIGPGGHVILLILAGENERLLNTESAEMNREVEIRGTYLSDGYGSSERDIVKCCG